MRSLFRNLTIALAIFALAACAGLAPRDSPRAYAPLILISIDGYRADYIERGHSPVLRRLADGGVRARALKSSFPTLTFPNHYTIVTGLYPDHHGIVHNRIADPISGKIFVYNNAATTADPFWWGGEPLWVSVEKQGKHAATMFWPGSDVAIAGVRPEQWLPFDGKITSQARVDQVLSWIDLPPDQRPDFITLYFDQVDHAGHDFGPDTPQVDIALAQVDEALGHLVDGLQQRSLADATNIVVVSDHGMTRSGPDQVLLFDDLIDADDINGVTAGVLAGFAAKPGHEAQVESAVLRPHEHARCWRKSEMPARFHYGSNPRIPPLLCLADDGWLINSREYMARPNRHISNGEHGYDNDDPKMRALFVANGPAFRHGLTVPEFDNVDIYPMLTKILGVKPAPNDGNFAHVAGMMAR